MKTYLIIAGILSVLCMAMYAAILPDLNPPDKPEISTAMAIPMGLLMGFTVSGVIYIPVWLLILRPQAIKRKKQDLWDAYQAALKGSDKEAAVKAGRAYFGATRGGFTTSVDEMAINNDLMAMK
jgi:hypothetical protein